MTTKQVNLLIVDRHNDQYKAAFFVSTDEDGFPYLFCGNCDNEIQDGHCTTCTATIIETDIESILNDMVRGETISPFVETKIKAEVYCSECNRFRNVDLNRIKRFPHAPETGDDWAEEKLVCVRCGKTSNIYDVRE